MDSGGGLDNAQLPLAELFVLLRIHRVLMVTGFDISSFSRLPCPPTVL
jgi:hypothetical protein